MSDVGSDTVSQLGFCFLILRVYRGKMRVLSMHATRIEAEIEFEKAAAAMRDGDVILAKASLEKLKADSGGYNRTRW